MIIFKVTSFTSVSLFSIPVPTEKGATGLSNLGNTCFMNSSIQCVSNTKPLTDYFISGRHLYELNRCHLSVSLWYKSCRHYSELIPLAGPCWCIYRTNPIGMRGHMAKCYGDLVMELWSGTQKNVAPLKLRVSKFPLCHTHEMIKTFLCKVGAL